MIKKLILRVCKITGLTPYDVMEGFTSGAITAVLLLISIYPTFYLMVTIGKFLGL